MAVALYTKHSQLPEGAHNVTAVALSDNEGLWLLKPATCKIDPRPAGTVLVGADGKAHPRWGIECRCLLEDNTEEVTVMLWGDFVDPSGKEYDFAPASGASTFGHEPRTRAPSRFARSARHVVMYTE